jgi:hypothetical protein
MSDGGVAVAVAIGTGVAIVAVPESPCAQRKTASRE